MGSNGLLVLRDNDLFPLRLLFAATFGELKTVNTVNLVGFATDTSLKFCQKTVVLADHPNRFSMNIITGRGQELSRPILRK
jgi:hypothetical protein